VAADWGWLIWAAWLGGGTLSGQAEDLWDGHGWKAWPQAEDRGQTDRFLAEGPASIEKAQKQFDQLQELLVYFRLPQQARSDLEGRAYDLETFASRSDQPTTDLALAAALRTFGVTQMVAEYRESESKILKEEIKQEQRSENAKPGPATGHSLINPPTIEALSRALQKTDTKEPSRVRELRESVEENDRQVLQMKNLFHREMATYLALAFLEKRLEHVLLAAALWSHCCESAPELREPLREVWARLAEAPVDLADQEVVKLRTRIGNRALGKTPLFDQARSEGEAWKARLAKLSLSAEEMEKTAEQELKKLKEERAGVLQMIREKKIEEALDRLQDLYGAAHALIQTRAFPVGERARLREFVRKTDDLKLAQKRGDADAARDLIRQVQAMSSDFDASKHLGELGGKENEIKDAFREAKQAIQKWDREKFQQQVAKAEQLAPGNREVAEEISKLKREMDDREKQHQKLAELLEEGDLKAIHDWQKNEMTLPDPAQQARFKEALEEYQKQKVTLEQIKRYAEDENLPAPAWDEAEESLRKNPRQEELAEYQKTLESRIPVYVAAIRKADSRLRRGDLGAAFHWYLMAKEEWEGSKLAKEGLKKIAAKIAKP